MEKNKKRLIIGSIVLLVVAVFIGIDVAEGRRRWQASESVSATIVDYQHSTQRRARGGTRPITTETLEFWYNGTVHQARLSSNRHLQRTGETVYILVESTEPMLVYHDLGEPTWADMVSEVVVGSVFMGGILGIIVAFMAVPRDKSHKNKKN